MKVPIHLHSHYTSGMASMSALMAILGGLDMLDTSISPLAGGTSHPPTETLVACVRNTPYDTGLDLAIVPARSPNTSATCAESIDSSKAISPV